MIHDTSAPGLEEFPNLLRKASIMSPSLEQGIPQSYIDKVTSCAACHGLDLSKILNNIPVKILDRDGGQQYHWEVDRLEITSASEEGCRICGVIDDFFEALLKDEEVKAKQKVEFQRSTGNLPRLLIILSWGGETLGGVKKKTFSTYLTIPKSCE